MNAANIVFNAFSPFFTDKTIKIEDVGTEKMPFPSFPLALIKDLLQEAEKLFSNEISNIAYINGDIFIVGDIHGNIRDLLRILASGLPPPTSRYLFLGDYVDRGDYSIECITLLLALSVKFPHHIILLRGNHEYDSVNSKYGFMEQVIALYGQSGLYESFNRVFSYLQIAALISNNTLCIHGGLSPRFIRLNQLEEIDRTLNPPCDLLNDIIWSDPSEVIDGIIPSNRGYGYVFGYKYLNQFLSNNNLTRIIRGHECVKSGVKVGQDSKIITVFSSCNYAGEGSNQCGIIKILEDCNFTAFNFQDISILKRENAFFEKVFYEQKNQKINCMIFNSPSLNNMLQSSKISKRNNSGKIPLCCSTLKLKTMRAKKYNSQVLLTDDSMRSNDPLPSLSNSSVLSNSIHNDNLLKNQSLNNDDENEEKISLLSLSPNHYQTRTPQIKKQLKEISKSQSFD